MHKTSARMHSENFQFESILLIQFNVARPQIGNPGFFFLFFGIIPSETEEGGRWPAENGHQDTTYPALFFFSWLTQNSQKETPSERESWVRLRIIYVDIIGFYIDRYCARE